MALNIGMCFDRSFPATAVVEFAEQLEADGVDQLWVIEDCFYTGGISLAATALARTERLTVGIGILPAVARNPAVTAMEIATLADLAPGRVLAGIGHGVQDWMAQMGAKTPSPLTTLEEAVTIVRRLLAGETVSCTGREFVMDDVTLDRPPTAVPPVLAGVRGPKSLALAGRISDGVVLAEGAGPTYVAAAIDHAGNPRRFHVSVFTALCIEKDGDVARKIMAPFVCGLLASPQPAVLAHPHYDEMQERFESGAEEAIAEMPADWWLDIGAIGTFKDAITHIEALAEAGANDVALFPAPELKVARSQIRDVKRIASAFS
jgi:alkanesulfonate monooxygenase SsuD/methylene tetrahydromethanopterin reductase-like flavin-dependent oxidoreductase (luciferase family)